MKRRDLLKAMGSTVLVFAETSGEGSQRRQDPASGTNQGGVAMGFYNMAAGDAAYLRDLAQRYALADNYHQPIMGGTGALRR